MGLDMLLEILRTFKSFAAEIAFMRLQWHVDSNVRGDVVSLNCRGAAISPLAGEVEVVGALSPNMALANMVLSTLLVLQCFSCYCAVFIESWLKTAWHPESFSAFDAKDLQSQEDISEPHPRLQLHPKTTNSKCNAHT